MSIEQDIKKILTEAAAHHDVARYEGQRQHHMEKAEHHRMLAAFHGKSTEIKGQDAGAARTLRDHHLRRAQQHENIHQMLSDLMYHIKPNAPIPVNSPLPIKTESIEEGKLPKVQKKALKKKYKEAKKGSGPIPGTGSEAYES